MKINSLFQLILFATFFTGVNPCHTLAQAPFIVKNIHGYEMPHHHALNSRGGEPVEVYNILCPGYQYYQERFFSDKLFDAWSGLPKFVQKATRLTVNCDQYGRLWALTAFRQPNTKSEQYTQRNYLYDTTQKKVLYEKAIDTSVEYSATWIQISYEGNYLAEVETEEGGGGAGITEFLDAKTFKPIPGMGDLLELKGFFMGERYIYGIFKGPEEDSRKEYIFDTQTGVRTPIDTTYYLSRTVDLPGQGMVFGLLELESYTGDDSFWKLPGLQEMPPPADLDNGFPFRNRSGSVIGVYSDLGASFYDPNLGLLKSYQMAPDKPDFLFELDPEMKDGKVVQSDNRLVVGTYNGTTGKFESWTAGLGPPSPMIDWTDENGGRISSVFPDSRSDGFWMVCNGTHSLIVYVDKDLKIKKILRPDITVNGFCTFDPDRNAILAIEEPDSLEVFPLE